MSGNLRSLFAAMAPRRKRWVVNALVASAGFVPAYVLWLILHGYEMQYGDYYYILESLYSPSGRFLPAGLLEHANEHLILLPKLVFALNVKLFAGSNISLGVFVWLVLAATWLILARRFLPSWKAMTPSERVVMAWASAVLLFPVVAAHNFLFAMSGTAWLLANLFAVCALVALVDRRLLLAATFGVLCTFSYGTGIAVWPALGVILIAQRHVTKGHLLLIAAAAGSYAVEHFTGRATPNHPALEVDLLVLLRSLVILAGSPLSYDVGVAVVLGAIVVAVGLVLVYRGIALIGGDRVNDLFVGVAAYGLIALLLIAIARSGLGDQALLASRYAALASLLLFSFAVLLARSGGASLAWRLAITVLCMLALGAGVVAARDVTSLARYQQGVGAIAARMDVAPRAIFLYGPKTTETMRALGHFPFNAAGDSLACGLLGKRIPAADIVRDDRVKGFVDAIEAISGTSAVSASGWVYATRPIDCILIIDPADEVVGAGLDGWERADAQAFLQVGRSDLAWRGIARASSGMLLRVVVRTQGSQRFVELERVTKD